MEILLLFALAALLIGLAKGGLGGPIPGTVAVPLVSLIMPVSRAAGVILPMLMIGDIFALYFFWRKWDMHYIRLMLPAALVGIVMGTLLLATLDDEPLRVVLGIFTLIAVLYKLLNNYLQQRANQKTKAEDGLETLVYQPRPWHGSVAGWASGFGSALANVGAPPYTAYMLLQPNMTPMTFAATAALFFATVNFLKLPGFLTSGLLDVPLFLSIAPVLPIIPLAVWLGRKAITYFNPKVFEQTLLALLFILSLTLIF
jgi:uncharacterized protein